MTYEEGFTDGERRAFVDRKAGRPLESLPTPRTPYRRGYRDGYTPRSALWWVPRNLADAWKHHEDADRAQFARDFVSMNRPLNAPLGTGEPA